MDGAPGAEEGGGATTLGPFVTQSKMVSRCQPEASPSSDARCMPDFWDRLVQQPSYLWMEEYNEASPLLTSGCAARRPAGDKGGPGPWEVAPTTQSLPSPKELCQKKRKGPEQKGRGRLRGWSVWYHLEEAESAGRGGSAPSLPPKNREGRGPACAPADPRQDAGALREALPGQRHQHPAPPPPAVEAQPERGPEAAPGKPPALLRPGGPPPPPPPLSPRRRRRKSRAAARGITAAKRTLGVSLAQLGSFWCWGSRCVGLWCVCVCVWLQPEQAGANRFTISLCVSSNQGLPVSPALMLGLPIGGGLLFPCCSLANVPPPPDWHTRDHLFPPLCAVNKPSSVG